MNVTIGNGFNATPIQQNKNVAFGISKKALQGQLLEQSLKHMEEIVRMYVQLENLAKRNESLEAIVNFAFKNDKSGELERAFPVFTFQRKVSNILFPIKNPKGDKSINPDKLILSEDKEKVIKSLRYLMNIKKFKHQAD